MKSAFGLIPLFQLVIIQANTKTFVTNIPFRSENKFEIGLEETL